MAAIDPPDTSNLVGTRLGNYRLARLLGRGRMGAVYLADDTALLRPTAVKVLSWLIPPTADQDPVRWFLSEARLVARINHPRVVQIYGAAQSGSRFYIAMEYVPGESAEALLKEGPLAPRRATDIVLQVAAALHAAHRVGVVHRDVKPANILLDRDHLAKLGDFGMALTASAARASANVRAGTPYYTAPEIWLGSAATPSADLYSLGATFFHLLTGKPPYRGTDTETVQRGHLEDPVPDPRDLVPSIPEACARLVRRMLAKAPRERHASAQVLLWDVRRLQQELEADELGVPAPKPPTPQPQQVFEEPQPAEPKHQAATVLAQELGFARRPFVELAGEESIYQGPPLASVRARLEAWAAQGDAPLFALTGAEGSGRTTLARQLARRLTPERLVLYASMEGAGPAGSPLQRLSRAAGSVSKSGEPASRAEDRLDALLERLGLERKHLRPEPLLILDGVATPVRPGSEAGSLIAAASWIRSFKVLVVGSAGLAAELMSGSLELRGEAVPEVQVEPLDTAAVGHYVRAWLAARLDPRALPILLSSDAALLLSRRSEGVLSRVNLLAENMLLLAAKEGKRVLSSWHAWAASGSERWAERPLIGSLPKRGDEWPPAAFLDALDACRSEAGLPPYPRVSFATTWKIDDSDR